MDWYAPHDLSRIFCERKVLHFHRSSSRHPFSQMNSKNITVKPMNVKEFDDFFSASNWPFSRFPSKTVDSVFLSKMLNYVIPSVFRPKPFRSVLTDQERVTLKNFQGNRCSGMSSRNIIFLSVIRPATSPSSIFTKQHKLVNQCPMTHINYKFWNFSTVLLTLPMCVQGTFLGDQIYTLSCDDMPVGHGAIS